jgi:hypothetical protein
MRKRLVLEEHEVICSKCKGKGYFKELRTDTLSLICPKCFGKGKLDWVENVVGKRNHKRYLKSKWYVSDVEDFKIKSISGGRLDSEIERQLSEELAKKSTRKF